MVSCNCLCAPTKIYQGNGDVLFNCKANNGRVVMQWLAETVADAALQNIPGADDRLGPTALCMPLEGNNIFLNPGALR